jgi:transcriptional regulator with XRE-family HTH domain
MEPSGGSSGPRFRTVGRLLKRRREAFGLQSQTLAERASLNKNLVTHIEQGRNVRLGTLHKYAAGLGYRDVVEMFRAADPETRLLLRLWERLGGDDAGSRAARKDALDSMQRLIEYLDRQDAT